MRPWMPPELSALVWFATDDSSTSPRIPVYGSNRQVAEPYAGKGTQDGVAAPLLQFDTNKAFWVQNMVSNFCYFRWQDAYPVVREKIDKVSSKSSLQQLDFWFCLGKQRPSPWYIVEACVLTLRVFSRICLSFDVHSRSRALL